MAVPQNPNASPVDNFFLLVISFIIFCKYIAFISFIFIGYCYAFHYVKIKAMNRTMHLWQKLSFKTFTNNEVDLAKW